MSIETFRKDFERILHQLINDQISQNEEFYVKVINNPELYKEELFPEIHKLLKTQS